MHSSALSTRWSALLLTLCLVGMTPLLGGCLQRSTTVGDRFSGSIIVATTPDDPAGKPRLNIPESMASDITLSDYNTGPAATSAPASPPPAPPPAPGASPGAPPGPPPTSAAPSSAAPGAPPNAAAIPRTGTRASFTDLTAGQLSQLGDIVANSFGDSTMSVEFSAKRNGDVVRFRGTADLSGLTPDRDFVQLTLTFGGPLKGANGEQIGDNTARWTLDPRTPTDLTADATYPDPATAAVTGWSWLLALVCLAVVGIAALLAWRGRDRSPRPGRTWPGRATTAAGTPKDTRDGAGTGSRT